MLARLSRHVLVALASALVVAGCTISRTDRAPLSGPSEVALSLAISANPDLIAPGGTSQIVVQARDANGQALKKLALHFDISVTPSSAGTGTLALVLPATKWETDSDGRLNVEYTAPNAATSALVTIGVTPIGSDYATSQTRVVTIRLIAP